MIKLLRVDHRLLHGQVAMAWTQSLDSDCILIANDAVVNDNIRKTTMKLAKPNGVKRWEQMLLQLVKTSIIPKSKKNRLLQHI